MDKTFPIELLLKTADGLKDVVVTKYERGRPQMNLVRACTYRQQWSAVMSSKMTEEERERLMMRKTKRRTYYLVDHRYGDNCDYATYEESYGD